MRLHFVPSAQYMTVPASQKRVSNEIRYGGPRLHLHDLDFMAALALSVDRNASSNTGRSSCFDRGDLFFGQPNPLAPAGETAFSDRQDLHDLAVGPAVPAEAAAEFGPLPPG